MTKEQALKIAASYGLEAEVTNSLNPYCSGQWSRTDDLQND